MSLTQFADTHRNVVATIHPSRLGIDQIGQTDRIRHALGAARQIPKVTEETHARYYGYLLSHLTFPFAACYPRARNADEEEKFRCNVLTLLDPVNDLGDGFHGIFAKTSQGEYEINLPLIELDVPQDSPNFQLIEDYWYWFWNWR